MTKKEKTLLGITGICVLAFLIVDPFYFWRTQPVEETGDSKPKQESIIKPAVEKNLVSAESPLKVEPLKQTQRDKINFDEWHRDPFVMARPDLDAEGSIAGMKLGMISVRGEDRMALINAKPVRVGDNVGGMKVSSIESDRVTLETGIRSYTLTWEK